MRFFCAGEIRANTRALLGDVGQRRVRHVVQFVARDDVAGFDSNLRANVAGDAVVVAGDDLDLNTILLERSQNLGGVRQRRISKSSKNRPGSDCARP